MSLALREYRKKFEKWEEEFNPVAYGYTWEEYDNGKIDLKEEFIKAYYGNSDTAAWLREEL